MEFPADRMQMLMSEVDMMTRGEMATMVSSSIGDAFDASLQMPPGLMSAGMLELGAPPDDEVFGEDESSRSDKEEADALFEEGLKKTMEDFWATAESTTRAAVTDTDFTRHDLPLARIRRIMRQDACDDPKPLGNDACVVMAYATELFIASLTKRAWAFSERENRHTLKQRDLLCGMMSSQKYDFLVDIVNNVSSKTQPA